MLRSPTHVPTIQLTQIHHSQYDVERRAGATAVSRKLYHDHYCQPSDRHPCKQQHQQHQQQQQQHQQQQQQQQQHQPKKADVNITTTAPTTKSSLFTSARSAKTTKIKSSDANSGGDSKTKTTTATLRLKISNLSTTRTTAKAAASPVTPSVALTNAFNVSSSSSSSGSNGTSTKTWTPPSSATASPISAAAAPAAAATRSTTAAATQNSSMSPTSQTATRTSLFDSCHRKIRLIGGGPVAFLGGLVAKARRKDRDGDQNSTDTKLYLEESVLERKLPEADLKALVDLPAGLDYNEWLASHTLALFEHVNLVYGTVSEFCTPSGCPDMTGPGNRTYLWFDEKGKKTRVAAPQYIDYVMTFTQKTVSDESIFPTKYANEFPGSFECIARKILRLQFHVIAHLYAAHFREIALLGLHTHLNLTFAHLTALHRRFNLIDEKETDVLRDLEVALRLTDDNIGNHVQQAPHSDSHNSSGGSSGGGGSGGACEAGSNYAASAAGVYAAGSQQHVAAAMSLPTASTDDANRLHVDAATSGAPAMDSNAKSLPICTQPEAKSGGGGPQYVFGGGGGLMGGILGDFAGSDFSDNSRYCTSAVPPSSYSTSSTSSSSSTNAAAANASSNHGAGALHLNFSNNFAHAHHQHHPHHHHHHHHHQVAHQQNLGLLQCNANAATPTPHSTTTA